MYGVAMQNLKFLLHFDKFFRKFLAALWGCASIMWFILISVESQIIYVQRWMWEMGGKGVSSMAIESVYQFNDSVLDTLK